METGINFEAVCRRSIEQAKEPTDEAIVQAMHELSSLSDAPALALLTGDTGFLGTIVELKDLGNSITVLVEENRFGTISTYECAGVEVVRLQLASDRASKVRAVLHPNGSGSVKLSAEFRHPSFDDFTAQEHTVVKLMKDLGYRCQDGYLGHQYTKFWFTNWALCHPGQKVMGTQWGPVGIFLAYNIYSRSGKVPGFGDLWQHPKQGNFQGWWAFHVARFSKPDC